MIFLFNEVFQQKPLLCLTKEIPHLVRTQFAVRNARTMEKKNCFMCCCLENNLIDSLASW